jgi:hypothetical protein
LLKWTLAIVGGLWLVGISFWAAGIVDQIKTDTYQAQHHYRLDKATVLARVELPRGSWVSVDGNGGKSTKDLACTADRDVWFRTIERRLLERCVLADTATVGLVVCGSGEEIVLSGDGLDACTLA